LARAGYRITACAATPHQAAFVLSIPSRLVLDETQETLRTSTFPSTHVQVRAHARPRRPAAGCCGASARALTGTRC